jgi:hypothetical protein
MPECMHNICNRCLKKSISKNIKQIRCLECKANYAVNREVLEEFPKNITIFKRLKGKKNSFYEPQATESPMLLSKVGQISLRLIYYNIEQP